MKSNATQLAVFLHTFLSLDQDKNKRQQFPNEQIVAYTERLCVCKRSQMKKEKIRNNTMNPY